MSAAAQAGAGKAAPVLALFRQILRLHRDKLPPPMRAMGDTYVKDEFSRHLRGNTSEAQWQVFMQEWQRYHAMLSGSADLLPDPAAAAAEAAAVEAAGAAAAAGAARAAEAQQAPPAMTTVSAAASGSCGELADDVLGMLSLDQRARLELLRQRAGQFGRGLLTPEGSEAEAVSAAGGSEDGPQQQQQGGGGSS